MVLSEGSISRVPKVRGVYVKEATVAEDLRRSSDDMMFKGSRESMLCHHASWVMGHASHSAS